MAYTLEQQYSRDIDWYFIDGKNKLIHVASAGGRLPKLIEESDELIDLIHSQIIELPAQYEAVINPLLEEFVSFETAEARELYLGDFTEMARRGLISIDKTRLGKFEDPLYHIVAYPIYNITVELNIKFDNIPVSSKIVDISNYKSFDLFDFF